MIALIRGELIKIVTTRTLLGYAAAGVALTVLNVVIIAAASGDLDEVAEKQEALAGLPILLLLFGLVGAAGEHRHRTAAPAALVARCDRGRLLLARTGAYAGAAIVVGALMVAVSLGLGLPLLAGHPGPDLTPGEVTPVAGGNLVAFVLFAMMGVAIGAFVRNQVVGVVVVLILNFMINPLVAVLDETAGNYTPFGAAEVLARMTHNTTLSVGGAALVLAAWTLPLVVAAVVSERRRDLA
jgi:ABC-2 type transport system permease protein